MGTRRQARECALQMLYQVEMTGMGSDDVIRRYWEVNDIRDEDVRLFAEEIVAGVMGRLQEIDKLLASHSTNWKPSRMAAVDRNILRMAIYELMVQDDVPPKVAINEAVDIAKRYGTTDSGAFVNGVLDNIARDIHRSSEGTSEDREAGLVKRIS